MRKFKPQLTLNRHREVWIRSALVAMDFNHGAGREQAVDVEGNLRYKLNVRNIWLILFICNIILFQLFQRDRAGKHFLVKKIYEKKSMDWKKEICEMALVAVQTGQVPDVEPPVSNKRPCPPEFDKVLTSDS